jgi:hypothetical protein
MPSKPLVVRALVVGGLALAIVGGVVFASGAARPLAAIEQAVAEQTVVPVAGSAQPAAATPGKRPKAAGQGARGAKNRFRWNATSPAIHQGDRYVLSIANGATAQEVRVRTVIMDHGARANTPVIEQTVTLAPNEKRELTADNTYGTANHFRTNLVTENEDLSFSVTITDGEGVTASFNERAFLLLKPGEAPHRAANQAAKPDKAATKAAAKADKAAQKAAAKAKQQQQRRQAREAAATATPTAGATPAAASTADTP